ncbi:hypothetical protein KHC17_25480 (plasmid) [Agrobacterium salinitolerans]|nr:hypothetical protein KHC17_25480 [Agrobacterium salinitolerans]
MPDSGSAIPVTISGDQAMSRPDKDTQPEPGTDDARSGDSEESRRAREQARKNAEHMIEQRWRRQPPGRADEV